MGQNQSNQSREGSNNLRRSEPEWELLNAHQRETHFTLAELKKLQKNFKKVATDTGDLHRADFETVLNISFKGNSHSSAAVFLARLFDTFDIDQKGTIDFSEFVAGLSVLCRGSIEERTKFTFNIYDEGRTGYIQKEGMHKVLLSMSRIYDHHCADAHGNHASHSHSHSHPKAIPKEQKMKDFAHLSSSPLRHPHPKSPSFAESDIRDFITGLFDKYVSEPEKGMTFIEFSEAAKENPQLLGCTYDIGVEAEKVEGIYTMKYLVAVDGGEHSLRAFEHVARMARKEDCVFVVYVHPPFDLARKPPYMKKEVYQTQFETRAREMSEFLERCKNLSDKKSAAPCFPMFCEGNPQIVISELLDKQDISVLAMGSKGYGEDLVKSQRKSVGSLCRYFLDNSICSVLIVK